MTISDSDRTPDFMLEEYKQIANAYQDLHAQQNELVRVYLTLVAVPASVLAVVAQLIGVESAHQATLPGTIAEVGMPVLLALMVALCLVGLAVVLALVFTRAEALLYVRTVNCVRRYFVEHDLERSLKRYLVLPDFDRRSPPYWEGPRTRSFWNVAMVAFLNSGVFFATCLSCLSWLGQAECRVPISIFGAVAWFGLQEFLHWKFLTDAEKCHRVKFSDPFPGEGRIGIDLDGVLGDLAGEVIKMARSMFGVEIRREDITSHRLQECTNLTSEQVKEIFASTVFRTMAPVSGATEALRRLRSSGRIVHVVTDRFWSAQDWTVAKGWLDEHGFEWDHLNLVRAQEKAEYAQAHRISIFVEDNYETAVSLSSVCTKVYLLDRPYNQGRLPDKVIRASNWGDILNDLLPRSSS